MQSSQSSATIALRALVMLAFIIAIPLAAFNGSALPDRARKLLDKVWPTIASAISTAKSNALTEAPSYNTKSQNSLSVPSHTLGGTSNQPAQLRAINQANLLPQQALGGSGERFSTPASNVVPADYQSAVEPRINNTAYNSGQSDANSFMTMQDRLRQLGATYYLLETWGNQRQFYRFYCQMAVGGNSSYTHYFEATNANPLAAMADVLRQIEAWRGGGEAVR
jgi:hypothetical protein